MTKLSNFRKKKIFFLSISLSTAMCIIAFSCNKLENSSPGATSLQETSKLNNNGKVKLPPPTSIEISPWQDQIAFIKGNENLLSKNGITLLSFQLTKELRSSQEVDAIKSKILSEQSMIPVPKDLNIYTLHPISEILKSNIAEKKMPSISTLKKALDSLIKPGMETLIFKWLYKGQEFSSICVAIKGGSIVYENLISNVFTTSIENPKKNADYPAFKGTIARSLSSEPEPGGGTTAIYYTYNSPHYTYSNYWGTVKAEAYVVLHVTGTKASNGTKTITGNNATGYHTAESGFSAAAAVSVIPHPNNGSLQFAYGIAVSGTSAGLTLTWSGSGFTVPSGSNVNGVAGTMSIYPADLQ